MVATHTAIAPLPSYLANLSSVTDATIVLKDAE